MNKYNGLLFIVFICLCQLLQPVMAQQQKTLKESMADLKKSFHPDKAFVLPFSDSANEDLQAFLFEVKETKGVNNTTLKIKNEKAVITVDTKSSMVSVWNNLPKEIHNRYKVIDRTPEGLILTDSYQTK
jgi:hypothetical protein